MQESRIKCGIPGGIKFSSQVGKVGSHHLRRDPAIPTWDPGWDCWDPAYIPPDILPGSVYKNLIVSCCCFVSSFNCNFEKVKLKFVDVEKIRYFVLEFSLTKDIQVASFCCGYCFFSDCQRDQYHTCLAS